MRFPEEKKNTLIHVEPLYYVVRKILAQELITHPSQIYILCSKSDSFTPINKCLPPKTVIRMSKMNCLLVVSTQKDRNPCVCTLRFEEKCKCERVTSGDENRQMKHWLPFYEHSLGI